MTLTLKMEKLTGDRLHAKIHSALDMWMEGIRKVQARRKEEIINATNRHRNGGPRYQEEKGFYVYYYLDIRSIDTYMSSYIEKPVIAQVYKIYKYKDIYAWIINTNRLHV